MTAADDPTNLPEVYSQAMLARNLAALDESDPELARRVRLPVDGSHVTFEADGAAFYRLNRGRFPLAVEPTRRKTARRVLCLGIGLGEELERVLDERTAAEVVAWERDPWLLRLWLMRADRSEELGSGRLRLALGADLLDVAPAEMEIVEHPFLGQVYAREIRLLRAGVGPKRALLCEGGLFVDQIGDALRSLGYDLWTLDLVRLAVEELDRTVERFDPELVAGINYTNGLAEFCRKHRRKLLCWEIDPSTTLPRLEGGAPEAFVFTWRKANVEVYRSRGFERVFHLPLAADPEIRSPAELTPAERERYGAPIAFVGSSLIRNVEAFRRRFVEAFRSWSGSAEEGERVVQSVLAAQRADFSTWRGPELLEAEAPGFLAATSDDGRGDDVTDDPLVLLGEIAASEKRLSYVANLGSLGIVVWGDKGWKLAERYGVRYAGPAAHKHELTRIYNATMVNVDVGRLYQSDIVTMRTFDVLACGSFVLVEHTDDLEELFELGVEVESYRTLEELREKAAFYMSHPERAAEIARRGRAAVLERHTVRARVEHMLSVMGTA
ncbi:MAG: glycosyltransferase [Planctomycetota bacterium]|nr:glycosyltransferase [Planctomycetota bacterium]